MKTVLVIISNGYKARDCISVISRVTWPELIRYGASLWRYRKISPPPLLSRSLRELLFFYSRLLGAVFSHPLFKIDQSLVAKLKQQQRPRRSRELLKMEKKRLWTRLAAYIQRVSKLIVCTRGINRRCDSEEKTPLQFSSTMLRCRDIN